jgi:hypothetical protein
MRVVLVKGVCELVAFVLRSFGIKAVMVDGLRLG